MTFNSKFNSFPKLIDEELDLKNLKEKWEAKVHEMFGEVDNDQDKSAMEELVLEAMEESPETREIYIEILKKRQKKREQNSDKENSDLVVDNEGKLAHKRHIFSGENQ